MEHAFPIHSDLWNGQYKAYWRTFWWVRKINFVQPVSFGQSRNYGRNGFGWSRFSFSLWGEDHDFNMEEVFKEIAYFKGITYYTSEFCNLENPLPECFKDNLTYHANLVSNKLFLTVTKRHRMVSKMVWSNWKMLGTYFQWCLANRLGFLIGKKHLSRNFIGLFMEWSKFWLLRVFQAYGYWTRYLLCH